ncbi:unnamed protein product [Brassicogethes aeneus]|uniref:Uncharacterized protein n=1 Tax=Brassicogethes aeneus TaxID=1431903 RepID=A0A9P0AXN6_BRAAE|nr:unnamed protein product [Brassicogethes aeneus]
MGEERQRGGAGRKNATEAPLAVARAATGAHLARHRRRVYIEKRRGGAVTGLMYASQQGDVDAVRSILKTQSGSLFDRDRTGKSALHYCSTSDSVRAAQAADLLAMAAPDLIQSRDEDGFTPLHLAVIAGNMQLVTFLLANKADVNAVDNEKHTVVHWATVCGETSALRAVLAAGAPVSTPDVHGGYPLHYAAQMCGGERDSSLGLQVLQTLLAHTDISVTVMDGDKRQPLLWAASAGSARALLSLIRAGANVEACDKDGLTALHCAASRGHTDCIDTLLTLCGASPDVIDSNGCTALHYAVTLGHADATALLLAHGADPNRQDRKGRSPAHCGCAKGQFETVKLIGSHGANLWLRNARGDLPLHEAAGSGRRELVKWLLDMRPSQVNARNNDGRCPIHMAALNDNSDMCKILLDAGAQINPILRTSKNVFMTPLDCALQRGFRSTAKFLQLHGGVPASRIGDGRVLPAGNSAMSLQIRDDVTFYTSSDSERENGDTDKSAKRTYRKKLACKYEKKKASTTESDLDSKKVDTASKRKTKDKGSKSNSGLDISRQLSSRMSSKSQVEYTNEVVINGTTEINIHQTKEIIIDQDNEVYESSKTEVHIPSDTPTSAQTLEKEKRPKSAKHSKLKSSSTSREKSGKLVGILKDQSTNTSDETTETVIDNFKNRINLESSSTIVLNGKSLSDYQDKQSIISNTSEDVEEQKQILVEASVHEPPKKQDEQDAIEDAKIEDKKDDKEAKRIEEAKNLEEAKTMEEAKKMEEATKNEEAQKIKEAKRIEEAQKIEQLKKEEEAKIEAVKIEEVIKVDVKGDEATKVKEVKEKEAAGEEMKVEQKVGEIIDTKKETKKVNEETISEGKQEKSLPKEEVDAKKEDKGLLKVLKSESEDASDISKDSELKSKGGILKILKSDDDSGISKESHKEKKFNKTKSPKINEDSSESSSSQKTHRSFKVLDEKDEKKKQKKKLRSKSEELKDNQETNNKSKIKSKIPTPIGTDRSERKSKSSLEVKVPSLPHLGDNRIHFMTRSNSNMSAPHLTSLFSDHEEQDSEEADGEHRRTRKRIKRRSRVRESKSAGSDYDNLIDSGFEPSPRSSRIPKWKNMSERGCNMKTVTQTIQTNIRRYHLERKIFQQLLELKRFQIRSNQHNEAMLVKRAIDQYHQSCLSTVGAGRYVPEDYTFKSFEKFLYESLRRLQKTNLAHLKGLPETANPLQCTRSTNRCMHTTHAYTGVPCAAYLPKMDHHSIPKIGFPECKPGTAGFLPSINPKKSVTLELSHGPEKQLISLPTDRLDQNKRYYVTFTVKGHENSTSSPEENVISSHRHSKSD